MAKEGASNPRGRATGAKHSQVTTSAPGFIQKGINMGLAIRSKIKRVMRFFETDRKWVRFTSKITTVEAQNNSATVIVTYNLGVDDNYLSEANREKKITNAHPKKYNKESQCCQLWHKHSYTCDPSSNSLTVKGSRRIPHLHRLPDLAIECCQSKWWWQCIDMYEARSHGAQRRGCINHCERRTDDD